MDMWMTTNEIDIEVALLWKKSLTEDFKVRNRSLLVCMSSLFHEEKKLAVCCNLNRDMVTVIGQHDTHRGGSTVCDGGALAPG
ncbi:unnamed protein product [Arabidopsis thaliana]|uniref:F-box associated beta-propeller type 1 domain-containing protein n=1 Tax=Arabidopsis thaliana TaxID=3702 RepID=A0A5S9XEZ4_ARATH|nr:unnamed protein product [Arabidopsis thaliana]